jgi:tellurite resistance protein
MSNRQFLQGLIAAKVALAEVHGELEVKEMSDQTWILTCKLNKRLNELIKAEVEKLGDNQ